MNRTELKALLEGNHVPSYVYNLSGTGPKDERFNLEHVDSKWYVSYMERGIKTTNLPFDTEDEACRFLYKELID